MAAIINLPSSPKVSAAADKPQSTLTNSSAQSEGFSQALSQQIEKKQSSSNPPAEVDNRPVKTSDSVENQPLKQTGAKAEPLHAKTGESAQAVTEETTEASTLPVEAALVPLQHPGLQELLAMRMGMAGTETGKGLQIDGNSRGGKDLPSLAGLVAKVTDESTIAEVMAARTAQSADSNSKSQTVKLDERALIALQQQAQQQLAKLNHGDVSVADLKQTLHGVENALQSLSRSQGEHGEQKGLEQAREQLIARLQGMQGQNAQTGNGNSEQQANSSKLPFMQTMNTEEAGKLSELSKLTRVAFQEMLAQQSGNSQAQAAGISNLLTGPAVSMNSLSTMLSPTSGGNPLLNYAATSSSLNVPVNHPGWGQAVGERLQWMVKQDVQQAQLKLNPRNMGPIEIKIAMNQEQATVTFVANHAMTREALDAAVPRLREMFGESGLNLVDVNVSQNPDTSGQRANERGDGTGNGRTGHMAEGMGEQELSDEALSMAASQAERWYGTNSVLDAYA